MQSAVLNCLGTFNPDQKDTDNDGAGDLCDPCPLDPDDVDTDQKRSAVKEELRSIYSKLTL